MLYGAADCTRSDVPRRKRFFNGRFATLMNRWREKPSAGPAFRR
jgi:hypothetical protein